MRILLTGAAHPLGVAAVAALAQGGHTIRATDTVAQPEGSAFVEYHQGGLTDPTFVAPLLAGIEAIVHLAPLSLIETLPAGAPGEILDAAARGTHVLLKAAVEGGAGAGQPPVVVQGSTLAVMDAYPEDLEVTEQWRPRPQPHAAHLAPYLAELTAREYTRDVQLQTPLRIICLRFAPFGAGGAPPHPWPLSLGGERGTTREQHGPTPPRPLRERGAGGEGLSLDDASRAIVLALSALQEGARQRGHRWQLYHIASPSPDARYSSAAAQRTLSYATATAT